MPQVEIFLASHDGVYRASGAYRSIPLLAGAIIATLIFGGALAWLINLRRKELRKSEDTLQAELAVVAPNSSIQRRDGLWFASLFLGNDGQPSLSLFQIFFWTAITVWAMIYVYVVTGDLLTMTSSMMALLGIAGTGSVIARLVASGDPTGRSAPTRALVAAQTPYDFWQMLATDGKFDLLKLQFVLIHIEHRHLRPLAHRRHGKLPRT